MPHYTTFNTEALTATRSYDLNASRLSRAQAQLSSGNKLVSAGINPAAVQISELLTKEIRGLQASLEGMQTGSSVLDIADGALGSSSDLLQRARELTVQAGSDTLNTDQRNAIQQELNGITAQLDQTSQTTQFNGKNLLDGSQTSFSIPTDANGTAIDIAPAFGDSSSSGLGLGGLDVSSSSAAQTSLNSIDTAIQQIGSQRAYIGATSNQIASAVDNAYTSQINQTAARSTFADTDIAATLSDATKYKALMDVSTTLLQNSLASFSSKAQLIQQATR